MKIHKLKTYTDIFQESLNGNKPFEIRVNDRDFQKGDVLVLMDYDRNGKKVSDRQISWKVSSLYHGGEFGIEKGHVAMGLREMNYEVR